MSLAGLPKFDRNQRFIHAHTEDGEDGPRITAHGRNQPAHMTVWTRIERKAAYILGGIAAGEGLWVYVNVIGRSGKFWRYIGATAPADAGPVGWLLGFSVAAVFVWYTLRVPSVKQTLVEISRLKLLGLAVAIGASLCEESIFRKWLMDRLQAGGFALAMQIAVSALTFGVIHGIWAFMGRNIRAGVGAIGATSVLGALLANVYLVSHRILLPCVMAHFLIDACIEPGLVLGGLRGEMGRPLPSR